MTQDNLLDELKQYIKKKNLDVDLGKIDLAYVLASESHTGQKRRSGENYILHPIEVAKVLVDFRMDTDTIVTGILHDVVEDTLITLSDIEYMFGKDVRKLVDGVTKLRNLPKTDSKRIENTRKMIFAMSEDIRVVIIKLADRLHNMRTLSFMTPEKQREKSKETIEIYAPIANRIGMAKIKSELEDISFSYLYPEEYKIITELVASKREERDRYTSRTIDIIKKEIEKNKLNAKITGRSKHLYSIYKKMYEKGKKFTDLYDLIAVRIIVDTEADCYHALGIIHGLFEPMSRRFKDYIAVPKPNGYQSIHTTIKGPDGQYIEIQIRTKEMHAIAENGVAAHWKYKEKKLKDKNEEYYAAMKDIIIQSDKENGNGDFVKNITTTALNKTVFVFTPKEDVVELQAGSTALDFAFQIHTQIGYKTIGAKINDKIVPLDQVLKNGDKIEVLTTKQAKGPGNNWINLVNNNSTKNKIRKWFKDKEYEEKIKEGEEIVERELAKLNLRVKDIEEDERLFLYFKKFNIPDMKEAYYKFAIGDISIDGFIKKFEVKEEKQLDEVVEEETKKGSKKKAESSGGIKIDGTENTMYHFAKCCSPLPGDEVGAFITKVRGIVIHKKSCPNFLELREKEGEREITVSWDESVEGSNLKYEFYFTVKVIARQNILLEIIKKLNDYKMELLNVNKTSGNENGVEYNYLRLSIMIKSREDFEKLTNSLLQNKDIIEIIKN